MSNYQTQNDINRITKVIELLENIYKFNFETEEGKEFGETIKKSIDEIIKPFGREYIIKLRKQLK